MDEVMDGQHLSVKACATGAIKWSEHAAAVRKAGADANIHLVPTQKHKIFATLDAPMLVKLSGELPEAIVPGMAVDTEDYAVAIDKETVTLHR